MIIAIIPTAKSVITPAAYSANKIIVYIAKNVIETNIGECNIFSNTIASKIVANGRAKNISKIIIYLLSLFVYIMKIFFYRLRKLEFFIDIYGKRLYNTFILSQKEIWRKGGFVMNNADLVWRLVELLLQKEKDLNQIAIDKVKNDTKPNDQKPDEA
jgi:hypothetical protein